MESLILVYNFFGLTCALALAYVASSILNWVWLKPKKIEKRLRQQGLNGNPYKMLFGDIKENARIIKEITSKPMPLSNDIWPRLFPIFHQAVKDHGKNCFVWFGPTPGLNVTDPKLIKEILSKKKKFQKPKTHPLIKLLLPGLTDHDDEKWTKHRKIINPAFHMEKLKLMLPLFYTSCVEMLSKWDDLVSKDGLELDVWPYIQALTIDAISRTAFSCNYREGRTIFELQQEQSQLVIESLKSIYIPGYRFLPTKKNNRMKAINNMVNSSLAEIINERVKAIEEGETSKNDLLGILLDSNLKEIKQHGNDKTMGMTIDDIIEECKLFYLGGQEPTSALLVWTMILLSWNQEWQHRARCEVLQVFGNDTPNFENVNHLKIVTMILYEVLRLYSPVVAMNRTVHEETKLGDLSIPAGTLLLLPTMQLHRDPEIWGGDANEFNPERFVDGVSKASNNQLAYFPFSFGPRVCIGKNFAMLETKVALAMIIKQFSFELSPSYAHAPFSIVTVQPQYGAHLILHKL